MRVGVVRHDITGSELEGIHTDCARAAVDQTLRDKTSDRVTDGAILTELVFILECKTTFAAVRRQVIGCSDEIEDLLDFVRTAARVHRISANSAQVIEVDTQHLAIPRYS